MTSNSTPPLTYGEPVTITTEPGKYAGVRSQRVRLGPDAWVTVHEDGRLTLSSYTHRFVLTYLHEHGTGAGVSLRLEPLAAQDAPPAEADL